MRQILLIPLMLCISVLSVDAQSVFTPRNIALGGGGSTYITDYNANFYNPANLMIQDREASFSFGIGVGGFYLDAPENFSNPNQQFENSKDYIGRYQGQNATLSSVERSKILEDNYLPSSTLSDNRSRYDATLFGMKWMRENHTISIAIRTRTSSNFRVGKGWYTSNFEETTNDKLVLDRSLIHRYQTLHEISFGYAESFQFLTGLTPRIDNFVIGIAPKLVLGGSYQDANWVNIYERDSLQDEIRRIEHFSYNATGQFGASTISYLGGLSPKNANSQAFDNSYFTLDGIGAGLDIGVTYLITLGSDLSAVRPELQPTQKSLRLSFSMTDIGFVSYTNDEISITSNTDTTFNAIAPNNVSAEIFTGSRGQYIDFIEKYAAENPFVLNPNIQESFSALLPMALHGGALLEINRLKLMGDISIGLTNNAFNSTKLISSVGLELRPLQFLPLRGGIRLKAQRPEFLSLGTAIETKNWDFSIAAQFTPNSLTSPPAITGISVATLQFHF